MGRNRLVSICVAAMLLIGSAKAQSDAVQAFDAQVPFAPVVADSAGVSQLTYELHLTNFAREAIEIKRVAVVNSESGDEIGAATGDILAGWMGRPGGTVVPGEVRTIQPGMRGIVYFNLPLSGPKPSQIAHRIEFRLVGEADGQSRTSTVAIATVDRRRPIALGPPLRGGPWAAVYAPEMERGHRRVVYATDGVARIPGRFAIDWIKLDTEGHSAPEGAKRLDAFHGYGAEVLAVADATVAAVRNDVENVALLADLPRVSIGDASGNYVSLDLGNGRYAFYEHLQRGVIVRPGQRVRRGQVIGRAGLTGQGSSPHLHFHVANANSLLGAEGLPFVLGGAEILGGYTSIEAFGRGGPWSPVARPMPRGPFAPGPNMVVHFLDR